VFKRTLYTLKVPHLWPAGFTSVFGFVHMIVWDELIVTEARGLPIDHNLLCLVFR
jgi:hypothetical protein